MSRMQTHSPRFMRCPNGHGLPHRSGPMRCSPIDCHDFGQGRERKQDSNENARPYKAEMAMLPLSTEGRAITAAAERDMAEVVKYEAQSKEAVAIMAKIGRKAAWDAAHAMPDPAGLPAIDSKLQPKEWVAERLKQIAPYALELKIRSLIFDGNLAAAEDLLDRAGFTRRPDISPQAQSPVIFVTLGKDAKSPYDAQLEGEVTRGKVQARLERYSNAGQRQTEAAEGGAVSGQSQRVTAEGGPDEGERAGSARPHAGDALDSEADDGVPSGWPSNRSDAGASGFRELSALAASGAGATASGESSGKPS
jgi:hypothetical protein